MGWNQKTGQPPTLGGADPRPWELILDWVSPFLRGFKGTLEKQSEEI